MKLKEILDRCEATGIQLSVEKGGLVVKAAGGSLSDELKRAMTQNKSRIVSFLEARESVLQSRVPPLEKFDTHAEAPLSFAQQRAWFVTQLDTNNPSYNMPMALACTGRLDVDALQRAFTAILERHSILRTVYREDKGKVAQQPLAATGFRMNIVDLRGASDTERAGQVKVLANAESIRPFDLERDYMLRVSVLLCSDSEQVLLVTMHHIASDGWSMSIFTRELNLLYRSFVTAEASPLPAPAWQYSDYAAWQRKWLDGANLDKELKYWNANLAGLPALHRVPLDKPRPRAQSYAGGRVERALDAGLGRRIQDFSRQRNATTFMTLQAAFAVLLHKYSGEHDIVVGSPIANRVHREVENLIGFFVNTLVLRTQVDPARDFDTLLGSVRANTLSAYSHQHLPFELLVERLNPERSLAYSPLFQIMFVMQNNAESALQLDDMSFRPIEQDYPISKYDLTLSVLERDGSIYTSWDYASDLFEAATIEGMAANFEALLGNLLATPALPLANVSAVSAGDMQRLLALGNHDWQAGAPQSGVPQVFREQAALCAESIALECGDTRLSYRELDARSDALAHALSAAGVAPGEIVGICLERSSEAVIGFLGILKAGAAYLPLDARYPRDRLAFMLSDTGARFVLTTAELAAALPATQAGILEFDALLPSPSGTEAAVDAGKPLPVCTPADAAYVIYTSGSTGKPKGVVARHSGIVRLVSDQDYVSLRRGTTILQHSSVAFDAATFEIWGALLNGGRLVIYQGDGADLDALADAVKRHAVDTMWITAGLFPAWADVLTEKPHALTQLLVGGDVVLPEAVRKLYEHAPGLRIVNGYGPTENTTFTSCHPVPRDFDESVPLSIGQPLRGTSIYLMSASGQLVPRGGLGELWTGGAGLARGYWHRPDLSAEKFVTHPLVADGTLLYRTGDFARWDTHGNLQFHGRVDGQVKIRGFRVEPGEIENQLLRTGLVGAAAVVARDAGQNDKMLCAFVVPASGSRPQDPQALVADIRHALETLLPDYMIPAAFTFLDAIPVNASGKADTRSLLALGQEVRLQVRYLAPEGELECAVAAIWRQLLKLERVGRDDDFFKLGGHSILLVELKSAIKKHLQVDLPIRDLIEFSTLARLAGQIDRVRAQQGTMAAPGPCLAFVFPGFVPNAFAAGRSLYAQDASYRAALQDCCERAHAATGVDLRAALQCHAAGESATGPSLPDRVQQAWQFCQEVALATWLESRGHAPQCVVGQGLGELVAAHRSGVLDFDVALQLLLAAAEPAASDTGSSTVLNAMTIHPARIRYYSSLQGQAVEAGQRVDGEFFKPWFTRQTRFSTAVDALLDNERLQLLELGPGRNLSKQIRNHGKASTSAVSVRALLQDRNAALGEADCIEQALHELDRARL